jgi:hypothetical protein
MLELDDFVHSNSDECIRLLKQFVRIEDADVREGVLWLMEDLANQTGQLVVLEDQAELLPPH